MTLSRVGAKAGCRRPVSFADQRAAPSSLQYSMFYVYIVQVIVVSGPYVPWRGFVLWMSFVKQRDSVCPAVALAYP